MRIGLFGCGWWGPNILRDLLSLGCEVGVVDPSESARSKALGLGAIAAAAAAEDLGGRFDGYVIATPLATHASIIRSLLPSGRPIFCEKALAASSSEAFALDRLAEGRLFTMHKWAYHGGVMALRGLIASGEMGRLQSVSCERLGWGQAHRDVDPVWILLPHDLSIVLHLLGELPPVQYASAEFAGTMPVGLRGLLGAGGVAAHIHVSARWPVRQRRVVLAFEHGMASLLDPMAGHLLLQWGRGASETRPDPEEQRPFDTEPPLLKELRLFVEHLRGGAAPPTTAREGALVVERLEALRAAAGIPD